MKPYPVALQLYSVREEVKDNLDQVLKSVADFGYVGVELASHYGKSPRELRAIFDDLGLEVVSTHSALPSSENRNEILEAAEQLGYKYHICGRGPEQFATREGCAESGRIFQAAAETLRGTPLRFGIHNHWWEFSNRFDGEYGHQVALDCAPDVFAQIDTYWVKVGGADPAEVIRSLGPRVPLLHIKDGPLDREKPMTAVGDGAMEWGGVMEAADEKTLEWVIVEIDRCEGSMLDAVERSVKYLGDIGFGRPRG